MPINDDLTITADIVLLRVLEEDWLTTKGGRLRPTSHGLMDSNYENSCFISNEASLTELQRLFPGQAVVGIPARVLRSNGYAIERRPAECPADYNGSKADHVVVGPPQPCPRNEYMRLAKAIVSDPTLVLLRMLRTH